MATTRLIPATKRVYELLHAEFAGDRGVNVWLGPVISADPAVVVNVGWSGGDQDEPLLARSDSRWAGVEGRGRRDEEIRVLASILLIEGVTDPEGLLTALGRLEPLLERAEGALRRDPSLGQKPPFRAEVADHSIYVYPGEQGLLLRLFFTVVIKTRN